LCDLFACGSMNKPRGVDFFTCSAGTTKKGALGGGIGVSKCARVTGDVISAVPSRVAWHGNGEVLVSGNASGRVVVMDVR